jgi:hypothetical protein
MFYFSNMFRKFNILRYKNYKMIDNDNCEVLS